MLNKQIISLLFCLSSFAVVKGQDLQTVYAHYQKGEVIEAKELIDSLLSNNGVKDINSLYLKGFIYKDFYKLNRASDSLMLVRKVALSAFDELLTLDASDQFVSDSKKSIDFLTKTFYNDAITLLSHNAFDASRKNFEQFETLMLKKGSEIQQLKTEYLFGKATKHGELYRINSINKETHWQGAVDTYGAIIQLDSGSVKANYNVGVLYYNKAVSIISELDYDEIDIFTISEIEDQSIDLFKKALPHMLYAFEQKPEDKNTIEGLSGIYFSLRDFDKSDHYKEMLE